MRRLKQYKTSFVVPSDDEIREGLEIAKQDNCVVRINYLIPYSGYYQLDIEPESTFEECYKRVHIVHIGSSE